MRKNTSNALILLSAIVVLGAIGSYFASQIPSQTSTEVVRLPDGSELSEVEAIVRCKDAITERLVSPSTAVFPGPLSGDYERPVLSENTWTFTTILDSQNSFGATVRSEWICVLDGDEDTIEVEQF